MSLPAWSPQTSGDDVAVRGLPLPLPTPEWAFAGATGRGIRVAVIDSGIDSEHPRVGTVQRSVAVEADESAPHGLRVRDVAAGDLAGHGTACAGIIRSLAPDVGLVSVRVLGENLKTRGALFVEAIRWAVDAGIDVVNLSLSSRSDAWFGPLHEVADAAYFRNTMLICAANNVPGPTYPSQYASVISVAAIATDDPWALFANPHPPVEFAARGIDVDVAWGGGSIVATGNSFAAPHVAGLVAVLLSKHPRLTVFQVKSVLHALAFNSRPLRNRG